MEDSKSGKLVESPHVMKVDETQESSSKHENEEKSRNELLGIEASKMCSPSVLMAPRLNCSDQIIKKPSELSRPVFKSPAVLRPSQLNGNVSSEISSPKPTFLLNPSRLNPFAKTPVDESNSDNEQKDKHNSKADCSSNAPKFLPLLQNGSKSDSTVKTAVPSSSTSTVCHSGDFVFGQNIQDRVVSDNISEDLKSPSCANANGTSDMLFSSAIKESPIVESSSSVKTQGTKSLSESAREYEQSRAVKRRYEEVEVKTGEEGETNVLQVTCKLFAFDKMGGGSWQERGRGILRLNDQSGEDDAVNCHSRLVFRAAGSLRVVLNTKIWAEMTVQRASDKSIRLTAFDSSGEIRVFLLTGNPEDIKQLQKHLEVRVKKEMEKQKSPKGTAELTCHAVSSLEPESKKLAEGLEASN